MMRRVRRWLLGSAVTAALLLWSGVLAYETYEGEEFHAS